jgi:hypothetical protein
MPSSSCLRWIVACAAGILLAACDNAPTAGAPDSAQHTPAVSKPAGSELPANMVAAVSSTKNANVVSVHFMLNGTPTVNKALPVDIAIIPHQGVSSLNVHFEAHDGLAVAAGNEVERIVDPTPEKLIKHQLVLLPGREGVFMVVAVVETESGEGTISRIYSIPVIVAPAAETPDNSAPG